MTYSTSARHRPFGPLVDQFCELLRTYPRVLESEVEEMISIYPQLTILEVGLLSSDDQLGERFDTFARDHAARLNMHWNHHLLFAIVLFATLAMMGALVWSAMH